MKENSTQRNTGLLIRKKLQECVGGKKKHIKKDKIENKQRGKERKWKRRKHRK